MYHRIIGSDPLAAALDFPLYEIVGEWVSHEGAPGIRIYRNLTRKGGGYYVEITYPDGARFNLPIKRYWSNVRYFDLNGFVGLAYDAEDDVLQLSVFGNYYRPEVPVTY